jgi:hypothetical protein
MAISTSIQNHGWVAGRVRKQAGTCMLEGHIQLMGTFELVS